MGDFGFNSTIISTAPQIVTQSLQTSATEVSDGSILNVHGKDTVGLQIFGTNASSTIEFEGSVDTNPNTTLWVPIPGVKFDISFPIATQVIITSQPNEIWSIGVKGLSQFRARISAFSGGNLNILAVVIA